LLKLKESTVGRAKLADSSGTLWGGTVNAMIDQALFFIIVVYFENFTKVCQ